MILLLALCGSGWAQERLVVIDQDGAGPGGSDVQSMLLLLRAPGVKVLGVTVVSGDVDVAEGTRHMLRALEMVGRSDVPVYAGASVPLVRTAAETAAQQALYGKPFYQGAFDAKAGDAAKPLVEGEPKGVARPGAADFLIRTVHAHPHQVTVFAAGPMTNLALAVRLDPEFASLARELVFMGGSLAPESDDPEYSLDPRHEFNFWFDPEAAHIVLTAPWAQMTETTIDISLQARLGAGAAVKLRACTSPEARYAQHFPSDLPYMWDELAALAWVSPGMIRKERMLDVEVELSRGYHYGDTITWTPDRRPVGLALQPVHVPAELDVAAFERGYLGLMCSGDEGRR